MPRAGIHRSQCERHGQGVLTAGSRGGVSLVYVEGDEGFMLWDAGWRMFGCLFEQWVVFCFSDTGVFGFFSVRAFSGFGDLVVGRVQVFTGGM